MLLNVSAVNVIAELALLAGVQGEGKLFHQILQSRRWRSAMAWRVNLGNSSIAHEVAQSEE